MKISLQRFVCLFFIFTTFFSSVKADEPFSLYELSLQQSIEHHEQSNSYQNFDANSFALKNSAEQKLVRRCQDDCPSPPEQRARKHHHKKHHHKKRCKQRPSCPSCFSFNPLGQNLQINMTMTIPQLVGPIPIGANLNVTPFAIGPDGKFYRGNAINIIPDTGFIQDLNPVIVVDAVEGNYTVGYFVALGPNSPTFEPTVIANFSGVIFNNPVNTFDQTITFPVQTLFLGSLLSPNDILTITANFPIAQSLLGF